MSFIEILERTLVKGYTTSTIDTMTIFVCIGVSTIIGMYIYCVYKMINKNTFYNKNFNLSLIALSIIVAAIILTIQSNVVVSLGMVGALSIVRFRTAVKDPLDLIFLFWSISVGIMCGAGYAMIAIVASIALTIAMIIFNILPAERTTKLIVINATSSEYEDQIMEVVKKYTSKATVRARTATIDNLNIAIEGYLKYESKLENALLNTLGKTIVTSVSIVEHNGDITA